MVQEPGFFTLTAVLVRMAWSRSVAVMFNRSPSASIRKFDRIGMVVLRSTTLCVAVSSFTRSWRLTVISIAAPCVAGFSTSVSTVDIIPPSFCSYRLHGTRRLDSSKFYTGHTLQQIAALRKQLSRLLFDCIHPSPAVRVENWGTSLDCAAFWHRIRRKRRKRSGAKAFARQIESGVGGSLNGGGQDPAQCRSATGE